MSRQAGDDSIFRDPALLSCLGGPKALLWKLQEARKVRIRLDAKLWNYVQHNVVCGVVSFWPKICPEARQRPTPRPRAAFKNSRHSPLLKCECTRRCNGLLTRVRKWTIVERRDKGRREFPQGSLLQNRTPPTWCVPRIVPVPRESTCAVMLAWEWVPLSMPS